MKKFALGTFTVMLILTLAPRADFARPTSGSALPKAAKAVNPIAAVSVHGFFFFKGRVPLAFRNIDHLNLDIPGSSSYYGQIRLKAPARTDYKLLKPTLSGKNLSFKTKKVGGVGYEFSGKLTRTNFDDPQPSSEEVVLRGTLKKIKAGKVVAQASVRYTWFLGD